MFWLTAARALKPIPVPGWTNSNPNLRTWPLACSSGHRMLNSEDSRAFRKFRLNQVAKMRKSAEPQIMSRKGDRVRLNILTIRGRHCHPWELIRPRMLDARPLTIRYFISALSVHLVSMSRRLLTTQCAPRLDLEARLTGHWQVKHISSRCARSPSLAMYSQL